MVSWIDLIAEASQDRWSDGKPLFLAQIPSLLRSAGLNSRELVRGRSLREAIAVEGADKLRLVRNPEEELVWAVIPSSVVPPTDLSLLFKKRTHSNVAPRYKKWFWAAFIKPLEPGQRRFVLADRWIDIPESGAAPADALPVQRDEIVESQPGALLDYDIVHKAIDLWASRTSADLKQFLLSSGSVARPAAHAASLSQLASLDVEDMKRIMVPLDATRRVFCERIPLRLFRGMGSACR